MSSTPGYSKKYYAKNRERLRAKARAQYAADPTKFNASVKRYYEKNKERLKVYYKAWRTANPHKKRAQRLRKYGLTLEQYNILLEKQSFSCAICHQPQKRTLQVDHDHRTGRIRGLLCTSCNSAVGYVYDNSNIALSLANYLDWYENLPMSLRG